MKRKFCILMMLFAGYLLSGQTECPTTDGPDDGDTDVPVEALISWNAVDEVPGYSISIGTTPGGTDIVNGLDTGSSTSYRPPNGLPEESTIYVTLSLFFFDKDDVECTEYSFSTERVRARPTCATPQFPTDGLVDVNVNSGISWNYAPKASGYRLTLGTADGASDILAETVVMGVTSYDPPENLPAGTEVFARIVPFNTIGDATALCQTYSFTTRAIESLPTCSALITPANGARGVSLNPILEWSAVSNASGYTISIGTSPSENDILDNTVFDVTSTPVIDFEPNGTFFATVTPFNSAGDAIGCVQTTFSTIQGCFITSDGVSEPISLAPEIDLPETVRPCRNEIPFTLAPEDIADGYRWYKRNGDQTEELLSTAAGVTLSEPGAYRYEAYNTFDQDGTTVECESVRNFSLVLSESTVEPKLQVSQDQEVLQIIVDIENADAYEYALDSISGPYQSSTVFENLSVGAYTIFIRDKTGCDVAATTFMPDLSVSGFPKFFTPNGDGVNDFWQYVGSSGSEILKVRIIAIFDQFGRLIVKVDPLGQGWDGTFNGKPLAESDYWFRVDLSDRRTIQGHFTLKR